MICLSKSVLYYSFATHGVSRDKRSKVCPICGNMYEYTIDKAARFPPITLNSNHFRIFPREDYRAPDIFRCPRFGEFCFSDPAMAMFVPTFKDADAVFVHPDPSAQNLIERLIIQPARHVHSLNRGNTRRFLSAARSRECGPVLRTFRPTRLALGCCRGAGLPTLGNNIIQGQ